MIAHRSFGYSTRTGTSLRCSCGWETYAVNTGYGSSTAAYEEFYDHERAARQAEVTGATTVTDVSWDPHAGDHMHCSPEPGPDYCFTAKMRAWRSEGRIPSVKVPGGYKDTRRD